MLCIDGGGIRGAFAAHVLYRISEICGINPVEYFDLLVGTSTGSIIVGLIAVGKSPGEVVQFFKVKAEKVFAVHRILSGFGLIRSRYNSAPLKNALIELVGDVTLGEITKPLIIPATDIGNGVVHVLKSAFRPRFVRDGKAKLADAILASCSAPPYFDPHYVGAYLLADGGLWCNSPLLVGLTEAMDYFDKPLCDVRIVSLGTGTGKKYYSIPKNSMGRLWGLLSRWKHKRLLEMILNLQQTSSVNMAQLLLKQNCLRISYESDSALSLDDPTAVASLISRADKEVTCRAKEIQEFFGENNR